MQDLLQRVSRACGVEVDDLHLCSAGTLARAKEELKLPLAECGKIDVALQKIVVNRPDATKAATPVDLAAQVAQHLARSESERLHPWRATLSIIECAIKALQPSTIEDLRALYAEHAKAQGFSPTVAALLTALLYFDADKQRLFAASLLKHTPAEALQIFNVCVADKAFLDERGRSIVYLPTPLWPEGTTFAALRLAQFSVAGGVAEFGH